MTKRTCTVMPRKGFVARLEAELGKDDLRLIRSGGFTLIDSEDLADYTKSLHGSQEDIEEGNLLARIRRFGSYILKEVPVDERMVRYSGYYRVYPDRVAEKSREISEDGFYFPIVLHPNDIVDGVHRLNAIIELGCKEVFIFDANEADPGEDEDDEEESACYDD